MIHKVAQNAVIPAWCRWPAVGSSRPLRRATIYAPPLSVGKPHETVGRIEEQLATGCLGVSSSLSNICQWLSSSSWQPASRQSAVHASTRLQLCSLGVSAFQLFVLSSSCAHCAYLCCVVLCIACTASTSLELCRRQKSTSGWECGLVTAVQ